MDSSPNLAHKLNEYNKLAKIVVVQVMGSMEDEMTFNNLTFMKNKLRNHWTTHLDICVYIFNQNNLSGSTFPY
jgi:hypothetical protein